MLHGADNSGKNKEPKEHDIERAQMKHARIFKNAALWTTRCNCNKTMTNMFETTECFTAVKIQARKKRHFSSLKFHIFDSQHHEVRVMGRQEW